VLFLGWCRKAVDVVSTIFRNRQSCRKSNLRTPYRGLFQMKFQSCGPSNLGTPYRGLVKINHLIMFLYHAWTQTQVQVYLWTTCTYVLYSILKPWQFKNVVSSHEIIGFLWLLDEICSYVVWCHMVCCRTIVLPFIWCVIWFNECLSQLHVYSGPWPSPALNFLELHATRLSLILIQKNCPALFIRLSQMISKRFFSSSIWNDHTRANANHIF